MTPFLVAAGVVVYIAFLLLAWGLARAAGIDLDGPTVGKRR